MEGALVLYRRFCAALLSLLPQHTFDYQTRNQSMRLSVDPKGSVGRQTRQMCCLAVFIGENGV